MGEGNLEAGAGDASTVRRSYKKCLKKSADNANSEDGSRYEGSPRGPGVLLSGECLKLCWGKMKLLCLHFLNFVATYTKYLWRPVLLPEPPGVASPEETLTEDEHPEPDVGNNWTPGQNYADPEVNCGCLTESTDEPRTDLEVHEGPGADIVDVAELIQTRKEALEQKQVARRAAWREEVKLELEKRSEYKRDMEGAPLNQVEDKDKQKMSNASLEWRKAFRKQRTRFLFNEIFPIISKHYFKALIPDKETHARGQKASLSFVVRSRLVCSSWKEVIDKSISHLSSRKEVPDGIPLCFPILFTVEQLTAFTLWGDHTFRGRNPFFCHQLRAGLGTPGEWRNNLGYWNGIEKMLRHWGGEVWSLIIIFDKGSLEMMYIWLHKILSLTPNLRRLCLHDWDSLGLMGIDKRRELRKEEFAPLESRMKRSPLPDLPHLNSIVFGDGACAPVPLLQAMLTKYGNFLEGITFLGVGHDKFTGGYMDPGEFVSGRPLPLQEYYCQYETTSQISHWSYQFPSLNKLDLDYIDVEDGAEVENIFKTVNSCGSTLRRLRLGFLFQGSAPVEASNWQDRMPKGLKVELPQLEVLDLAVTMSKITDVDLLLPLVSLKELTFSYDVMKGDNSVKNGKGIIQFPGYRNRLYESNIWKLLPELRMTTIKTVPIAERGIKMDRYGRQMQQAKNIIVYDREGYQKHIRP